MQVPLRTHTGKADEDNLTSDKYLHFLYEMYLNHDVYFTVRCFYVDELVNYCYKNWSYY